MTRPEVSVVIPVRDGAATIAATLDALAAQEGAPPFEVIVVDNGSRDATAAVARQHPVGPIVVSEERPGSYAARNRGIGAARGTIIAFTDADCLPRPGWLRSACEALASGADLVGGRIEAVAGPAPNRWAEYDGRRYLDQRRFVERMGFAATANLVVKRSVFDDVGPFDPELFSGGDLEWTRRAAAAGHRLVYSDEAAVGHQPRSSLRSTWALHRRLGAGIAVLATKGVELGPSAPAPPREQEPAWVRRRRHLRLLLPHLVSKLAYRWGRATARPG